MATATPESILRQLKEIAYINQDFRNRAVGETAIIAASREEIRYLDYMASIHASDFLPPHMETEYRFQATREDVGTSLATLTFQYGYVARLHNISLPEHIVRYAYEDTDDPIAAAGPSVMEQSLNVRIDSLEQSLDICEKVEYFDKDGDLVAQVCTCPQSEDHIGVTVMPVMRSFDFSDDDSDDPGPIYIDPKLPAQFRTDAPRAVEQIDPSNQAILWDNNLKSQLDPQEYALRMAHFTLQGMKRAFRRQMGMPL